MLDTQLIIICSFVDPDWLYADQDPQNLINTDPEQNWKKFSTKQSTKICWLNSAFPFILYLWIRIHGPKWMRIRHHWLYLWWCAKAFKMNGEIKVPKMIIVLKRGILITIPMSGIWNGTLNRLFGLKLNNIASNWKFYQLHLISLFVLNCLLYCRRSWYFCAYLPFCLFILVVNLTHPFLICQ